MKRRPAELSTRYARIEDLDAMLADAAVEIVHPPRASLFLAAKAFREYRGLGGTRTGVLPNFFIGAQAAVMDWPLLTRDPERYRRYFPTVVVVPPATK
jgi:predicted nucleic acid-binding protein